MGIWYQREFQLITNYDFNLNNTNYVFERILAILLLFVLNANMNNNLKVYKSWI